MKEVGKLEVDNEMLVAPHIDGMGTVLCGSILVGGELCYEGMLSGQVKTA